ncbi:Pr6Pr family membrane protein [Streptomyces sp. NPDC097619]|uniref:Pr6Pr family membrane protein n=1 Tax=Streptomyces sp. NPDC097619 TaxID=3157228 RepID=UPI003317D7A8
MGTTTSATVPDEGSTAFPTASRLWHGVLLTVVLTAVGMDLVLLFSGGPDPNSAEAATDDSTLSRLVRMFSFFTIDSNVLVAVVCVLLIRDPRRDGRLWRVLRFAALLSIVVTGLVFAIVLAPKVHLQGMALAATIGLHYIAPPAALIGWLLFGPRGQTDLRTLLWVFVWPAAWIGYTLIHGAFVDWYPYPFLEVFRLGYPRVLVNVLVILLVAVVITLVLALLDRLLVARRRRTGRPRP